MWLPFNLFILKLFCPNQKQTSCSLVPKVLKFQNLMEQNDIDWVKMSKVWSNLPLLFLQPNQICISKLGFELATEYTDCTNIVCMVNRQRSHFQKLSVFSIRSIPTSDLIGIVLINLAAFCVYVLLGKSLYAAKFCFYSAGHPPVVAIIFRTECSFFSHYFYIIFLSSLS